MGNYWGDFISPNGGEDASPTITAAMVEEAQRPIPTIYLDNGMVLWFVTEDKIGSYYADGIDNMEMAISMNKLILESMTKKKHGYGSIMVETAILMRLMN